MTTLPEELRPLRLGRAGRALLPEIRSFAVREGIVERMAALSPFRLDDLCRSLAGELGYLPELGNRRRMIGALVDLLAESGWLERCGEGPSWRYRLPGLPPAEEEGEAEPEDGEIRFFRRCLELVPDYLRGREAPIGFDEGRVALWDDFLGCDEFQACRLALLNRIGAPSPLRLLDLCHGPGRGVEMVVARRPDARISAVDFTDSFAAAARRRAEAACDRNRRAGLPCPSIGWHGPAEWKGFGHPLPFGEGSFDAVLFGCGDPYVDPAGREAVYREIHRVLAPGGTLCVLTRGYPDPAGKHVARFWMRVTALVHDFTESVCAGWHGFAGVEESERLFAAVGFRGAAADDGRMHVVDSSLWLLRKGGGA